MAEPETNNHEEPTFPSKRKPDQEETHLLPNKNPKITTTTTTDQEHHNHSQQNSEVPTTAEDGDDAEDDNNEPENDSDDDEDSDEEPVVDRKGKGIMRDDKGKGKMIEEEDDEDDDSDDSDDSDDDSDGNVSGGSDSDFSDDPLAEVDLDNILPSRTRRRTAQTGVHISGGTPNAD